ncbi:hypothetical protein V6N13_100373 [Hibiscus sabdariffa]
MHASEQVLDLRTCSILLDVLCKRGELGEVLKVFETMRKRYIGLNLDTNSYNIVIDGFCKAGHIEAAKKLFLEVSVNGLKPNVYTYAIMIDGFCNEGLSEEAYQLFRSMRDNDCFPDSRCYNVMIQGFLRNNCISNAIQLLMEMLSSYSAPTTILRGESSTLNCKSLKTGQSFTYKMLKQLAGLKSQSVPLRILALEAIVVTETKHCNARDSNYTTSSQDNTYCFNTGSSARAVTILRMEGGTSSSLNKIMVFLLVMKKRLENLGVLSIVETKCCPCSGGFMGHCTKYT